MRNIQNIAAWIVILWGVGQARSFLIPLFLASLLSFLMAPVLMRLKKARLPELPALMLTSTLLFFPILVGIILLFNEGSVLIHDYPHIRESLRDNWMRLASSSIAQRLNLSEYLDLSFLGEKLTSETGKGVALLLNGLKTLAEAGAHLFVILFFSIIILASRTQLRKSLEKVMSRPQTLDEIVVLIEKFLIARIGIVFFVACVDCIILKFSGSKYSLLLSCLLGLGTLIPIVGFLIAILPPTLLSFAMGHSILRTGTMIGALYLVSFIEGHWLAPKYLGRQLNLNLSATFIGLFAGERIWGIWGMVLSIPLLGILRIILESSEKFQHWVSFLSEKETDLIFTKK